MEVLLFEALEGHAFQVLGDPAGCGLLDFDVFVARPFDDPLKMAVTSQVLRLKVSATKNNKNTKCTCLSNGFLFAPMFTRMAVDLIALLEKLG